MLVVRRIVLVTALISLVLAPTAFADNPDTIPPGTVITVQNWRTYEKFMPTSMVALFSGQYRWKMPEAAQIVVGPTRDHPPPKPYLEATEKYASQVKLVQLPDGRFNLTGYTAGIPFPRPSGPHAGWEILANLWYRYMPHLMVSAPTNLASECAMNEFGNVSCSRVILVDRTLKHVVDPGYPIVTPGAGDADYTAYSMVEEPEEAKYTANLTVIHSDLTQDVYEFTPSLRRAVQLSSAARCLQGTSDVTRDDHRYGFNGNITQFTSKLLGEKQILALNNYNTDAGQFPAKYEMPLGWPKPSWGKWELRDVYVIDVRRAPSMTGGYCYGKRIIYLDKNTYDPLWEDLYNSDMKLWKALAVLPMARKVPGMGVQDFAGNQTDIFWDLRSKHMTVLLTVDPHGHPAFVNQEVPKEYDNIKKYSNPSGLNQIFR
jgi:Protein of unknown function (DUF1329)